MSARPDDTPHLPLLDGAAPATRGAKLGAAGAGGDAGSPLPPPESRSPVDAPLAPLDALLAPLASLTPAGNWSGRLLRSKPAPRAKPLDKTRRLAECVGGERVIDLLFHMPERWVRRPQRALADCLDEETATLRVVVESLQASPPPFQRPWVVRCRSDDIPLDISFFRRGHWFGQELARIFPAGETRAVSGRLRRYRERWQMDEPEFVSPPGSIPGIQPVWPLVQGITWERLRAAMQSALSRLENLPEWQDPALLRKKAWPGFAEAIRRLQDPDDGRSEAAGPGCAERLAYDELLAGQLGIGMVRRAVQDRPGRAVDGDGALRARALAAFGHAPTEAQARSVAEIDADLAAPRRMLRLLQGDVGSGKTLVALLAMLRAVEAGAQAAIMAPTELLARQHLRTFQKLAGAAQVPVALLAGSVQGKERSRVLLGLASGAIPLVVGTHALFQDKVRFRDLALVVVDEQHRFGVSQRLALAAKGEADMLVMTATPIPRTLLLTQWGELAVSRLDGRPAGRLPIVTRIVSRERREDIHAALRRAFAGGGRAYWVVRAIEEGEQHDNAAAETTFAALREVFGDAVRLAHGAQRLDVRESALADFAAGRARLLVATTVVEVGVDVPEATIMIIEQAERFGLAALHQLRGRVGRGAAQSFCILLPSGELSETEKRRLSVLRDTEDGFVIADADLEFRGGGDALGLRQAGQIGSRLADPQQHAGLVRLAHRDAEVLLGRDPALRDTGRGRAAQGLLRLFGHDPTLSRLGAG